MSFIFPSVAPTAGMMALAAGRVKRCAQLYSLSALLSESLHNLVVSWAEQKSCQKQKGSEKRRQRRVTGQTPSFPQALSLMSVTWQ